MMDNFSKLVLVKKEKNNIFEIFYIFLSHCSFTGCMFAFLYFSFKMRPREEYMFFISRKCVVFIILYSIILIPFFNFELVIHLTSDITWCC